MTAPRTKSFTDLIEGQTAAVQGSASAFVDFSTGSILRAVAEASAQVALWLQGLILTVLASTRLATSNGPDADTWVADFGLTRLPASTASGNVTFSRKSGSGSATVPVGATVQSFDGSQSYTVTANSSYTGWTASGGGGYVMGAGVTSIVAPVVAQTAGAAGNAVPGTVTVITSAITGVDTVTNPTGFTGGANVETDAALRARFVLYIAGLSRATLPAIAGAVAGVPGVVTYSITENKNVDGSTHNGFFYVVVDDGTGSPSGTLLTAVTAAVEAVRPLGVTFSVVAPTKQSVTVVFKVAAGPNALLSAAKARAGAAVTNYINSLPVGAGLNLSRIAQVAYDSWNGVGNVFNITVNAGTVDIAGAPQKVIRTTSVTVNS